MSNTISDERSAASKERGIHPNLRKSIAERADKSKKKLKHPVQGVAHIDIDPALTGGDYRP